MAQSTEQMISLIATVATEQTVASQKISESASGISQLAERNSAAADETAVACKHLSQLAKGLDGLIRQFQIEDSSSSVSKLAPGLLWWGLEVPWRMPE